MSHLAAIADTIHFWDGPNGNVDGNPACWGDLTIEQKEDIMRALLPSPRVHMVLVDPDAMFYMRTDEEQSKVANAAVEMLDAGVQTFEWEGEYDTLEGALADINDAAAAAAEDAFERRFER